MSQEMETTMVIKEKHGSPIGQLNGPWSLLLRIALATYPLVLGWAVWVTSEQYADIAFRDTYSKYGFTTADAEKMRGDFVNMLAQLPPKAWQDRIITIEANQLSILKSLSRIESHLESNGSFKPR